MTQPKTVNTDMSRASGAKTGPRFDSWWFLVAGTVALIATLSLVWPDPYWNILRFVRDGIGVTLYITVISFFCILVVGLIGSLGRISKNPILYGLSTLYVELIRGIPALVQLIWWYFAFPVVLQGFGRSIAAMGGILTGLGMALAGYKANANTMAILGLTICYGAYMTEIYRAGIQSIAGGQMEAARSLGMTYFQSMRFIVIPQAIRVILPPVGNEFTALIKDSSLVSVVAVVDLTRRGREFMSQNFNPIEVWSMVALVYLVMTLFSGRITAWIENRVRTVSR